MFPTFVSRSEDFNVTFCLIKRNFAEETLYGISKTLYDNIYSSPIVNGGENVAIWFDSLKYISDNYSGYQYRLNIIENIVKYQLKNTTLTAEQIASALNFPDASYMHRYFKKHTGKSISQYRKDYNRNGSD